MAIQYIPAPDGAPVPAPALGAALRGLPGWAPAAGGWRYESVPTRVTAGLAPAPAGPDPAVPAPAPAGPDPAGHPAPGAWDLTLPLPRCHFHLREVLDPLAPALAGLGLHPAEPPEVAWERANAAAVAALRARGGVPPYLERPRADAWWQYTRARPGLRLIWPTVDIAIPGLLLFAPRDGGPVARVLVWDERQGAQVLPACTDWVVVRRDPLSARAAGAPPPALLTLDQVLDAVSGCLARYGAPVDHYLYRGGEGHPFRMRGLQALPGRPAREFRPVAPDAVVDQA